MVNSETTIDVSPEDNSTSQPQPDLIVLNRKTQTFSSNPQPKDLQLVVEISDSPLRFDLTVKAGLYARAEIVEYWVLDIEGRRLFCHLEPAQGRYTSVVIYQEHELLSPLNAPTALFSALLAP